MLNPHTIGYFQTVLKSYRQGANDKSRTISTSGLDDGSAMRCWPKDNRCRFTGIIMFFARTSREHEAGMSNASLDRIKSWCGYVKGNMQWVSKRCNISKGNMTDEQFIAQCHLVARHCPMPAQYANMTPDEIMADVNSKQVTSVVR